MIISSSWTIKFISRAKYSGTMNRDDEDGSITANLYRNLDDYRNERVMKPRFTYWL